MNKIALFIVAVILVSVSTTSAQLNQVFSRLFDRVLKSDLQLTAGNHGLHYLEAAEEANRVLRPALNALIANNISSFPLTSTAAGVTFDWSTGQPVSITESLGPIFAESGESLGRGKLNIGFNYSYLGLAELRGLSTKDIRFTFLHEDDENGQSLGNPRFEADFIDLTLGLDMNANLFAFFATIGVTHTLDFGVAVPVVDLRLSGQAHAVLNGPTAGENHRFKSIDSTKYQVTDIVPYSERAVGLGDIALRLKYNFVRSEKIRVAALLDVRFPTGDEKEFLGTGKPTTRLAMIWSRKTGNFTPHLNLAYGRKPAELDSDKFEFAAGFDQKVTEGITFAVDFLGGLDLVAKDAIKFFPENIKTIVESVGLNSIVREVDLTNIPDRNNDNIFNAALGFRAAPSERFLLLGNILMPLNDGGLRSNVVPTLGLTIVF